MNDLRIGTADDKIALHMGLNNNKTEKEIGKNPFARSSQCSAYVISVI